MTRAGKAGHQMAKAIIDAVHLMYQNDTARSYLCELIMTLREEQKRRCVSCAKV